MLSMGTDGTGIRADDVVCDVIGLYQACLKAGMSASESKQNVVEQFAEHLADEDDRPSVWLGLADAQWTFGAVDADVLEQVRAIVQGGVGLGRRREVSEKASAQRAAVLAKFLNKINSPNPRPRKPPRLVGRPPVFRAGDCLSVTIDGERYGAAIVLAADD
jgi:hypothetical protein